jgi:predicted DNA-binding transcriptional regulator YafY
MSPHFARHEQFLRIFTLLDILAGARQPIDDASLVTALKQRLGLVRLSVRTLHRDCTFLASCGYPIDHVPLAVGRRMGWRLDRAALADRTISPEPLTLVEMVAFMVARDLLRTFEGTVLWTGVEALRHKLEQRMPQMLSHLVERARDVFHVSGVDPLRYASRPRMISALTTAIMDCRAIHIGARDGDGRKVRLELQPLRIVIRPPGIHLLALTGDGRRDGETNGHVLLDIDRIDAVEMLDITFVPPRVDVDDLLAGC